MINHVKIIIYFQIKCICLFYVIFLQCDFLLKSLEGISTRKPFCNVLKRKNGIYYCKLHDCIVYRIDLFTAYYEETMLHIQLLRFLKNVFGSLFLYYSHAVKKNVPDLARLSLKKSP